MKKIYLSLIVAGFTANGAMAQKLTTPHDFFGELSQPSASIIKEKQKLKPINYSTKTVLWSEDFGLTGTVPGSTYTTANGDWTTSGSNGDVWKHSYTGTNGEWSTNSPTFASTSAANGFMLFDADSVNFPLSPSYINLTGELTSPSIDLTGAPSAKLTMQQDFRWCCMSTHNITVSVSTNGGATWGTPFNLIPDDVSTNDGFSTTTGGFDISANISGQAAGNIVKLKFTWDGVGSSSSHYYWTIDDIEIVELPSDDIQMKSAYIIGENNAGLEYGRTPSDQVDANYIIGASVYNGGANPASNTSLTADFGSFTSSSTLSLIAPDSTSSVENMEALTLAPGVYTGTYTVVSDGETAGSEFYNNTGAREFEITSPSTGNTVYSQYGIGVYTTGVNIGSLGTNSFTGGEDGLVCAALYNLKSGADVWGLRVMLATGTVAGAQVYGSIKDTSSFWAGDMSSLASTLEGVVATTDIAQGYIDLYFDNPASLASGVYYAAVELYSQANTTDIRIADDETVAQPFDASAIYIPGDQSYTNGTAFGIRMLMGVNPDANINENYLAGVSIYPNPSTGLINVTNTKETVNRIIVYDMIGNILITKEANNSTTIDLTSRGTGIYLVEVSNENGSLVERVIVK